MLEAEVSIRVVVAGFGVIVLVAYAHWARQAVNGKQIVAVDVGTCLTDETPSFVLRSPLTTTGLTELVACKATATTAKRIDVCKIGVFEVRGCGLREDLGIIAFSSGKMYLRTILRARHLVSRPHLDLVCNPPTVANTSVATFDVEMHPKAVNEVPSHGLGVIVIATRKREGGGPAEWVVPKPHGQEQASMSDFKSRSCYRRHGLHTRQKLHLDCRTE